MFHEMKMLLNSCCPFLNNKKAQHQPLFVLESGTAILSAEKVSSVFIQVMYVYIRG